MEKIKVVHYINQFFGNIGGEDKADYKPTITQGPIGPGLKLQQDLGEDYEITATIICGDGYYGENMVEASRAILEMAETINPDLFIAGPAFNAGRYGTACGAACKTIGENLNIPTITGMYIENPGVELYKKDTIIAITSNSSRDMGNSLSLIAKLAKKIKVGLGSAYEDGYIPQGYRKSRFAKERASTRAVKMLLDKINGRPYRTELVLPDFDRIEPISPLKDIRKATIALVSSGGIVPINNPDHIESASATKWGAYSVEGKDALDPLEFQSIHGGYDISFANQDPNRVVPLDAARLLEKEGLIGKLFNKIYITVGTGTSVANAKRFGEEIGKELLQAGVSAVILTST